MIFAFVHTLASCSPEIICTIVPGMPVKGTVILISGTTGWSAYKEWWPAWLSVPLACVYGLVVHLLVVSGCCCEPLLGWKRSLFAIGDIAWLSRSGARRTFLLIERVGAEHHSVRAGNGWFGPAMDVPPGSGPYETISLFFETGSWSPLIRCKQAQRHPSLRVNDVLLGIVDRRVAPSSGPCITSVV